MDLYSAFIVVPYTQGAQVRITQCYLQITPYLPLPRKHSPDGASPDCGCRQPTTHLSTPKGWKAESAWLADLQRTVYPHKWSPVSRSVMSWHSKAPLTDEFENNRILEILLQWHYVGGTRDLPRSLDNGFLTRDIHILWGVINKISRCAACSL